MLWQKDSSKHQVRLDVIAEKPGSGRFAQKTGVMHTVYPVTAQPSNHAISELKMGPAIYASPEPFQTFGLRSRLQRPSSIAKASFWSSSSAKYPI